MTTDYESFTVAWVPAAGQALAKFGTAWAGWCPEAGEKRRRIRLLQNGVDLRYVTADIARRGFHGVLHAPFRLRNPHQQWALEHALWSIADQTRSITIRKLGLAVVGGRVALVPEVHSHALDAMMESLASAIEPYAVPRPIVTTDNTTNAARTVPIRPGSCFHLPLTDPMPVATACELALRMKPMVAKALGGSHTIRDLALLADPGRGRRARVHGRYATTSAGRATSEGTMACLGPLLYTPLGEPGRISETA